MASKKIDVVINFEVLSLIILILLLSFGNSNAFSCSNQNVTLTASSSFICTSGWVNVISPVSLANATILAKGLFINNTLSITKNSTLNISTIINKGNTTINARLLSGNVLENYGTLALERPIFINFSYFLNKGVIINKNYLNNGGYTDAYSNCEGESYPFSYAGSGGGSLAVYSQCDGGNTLAKGGIGQVTSYLNKALYPVHTSSGNHVSSTLFNYSFNLSILDSAGGAAYNNVNNTSLFMRGGSGVLPLIIISKVFNNTGEIYNQGQSINYSAIKNASEFLKAGIVGAGGGGSIEVISSSFINNGTFNVSGGKIYLSSGLPPGYNASDLGYGGEGNVFFFKANNKLLLDSIHNYLWGQTQQNDYNLNHSSNYSNKTQNYLVIVKFQPILDCSLKGIDINLKGNYNNNSFLETKPLSDPVFSVNSSIRNLYLYVSGSSQLIHYYEGSNVVLGNDSNTSTETLNLTKYVSVSISFEGRQNLRFYLFKGNNVVYSGKTSSNISTLELEDGKYNLSIENGSDNYTYGLYAGPNCLGYENITILPGKPYYIYNSLNVSAAPFIAYKTNNITKNVIDYKYVNSCDFNVSALMGMDKAILNSIYSINNSISSNKVNYADELTREINYTNYILKEYNAKDPQNLHGIYINQAGLNLLSYYNNGNFTKEVFQINNNGTINLSYGNKTVEIVLAKKPQQNFFASMENGIIKAFSYIPSLFLAFLGGL
jgi:hypothetical protein